MNAAAQLAMPKEGDKRRGESPVDYLIAGDGQDPATRLFKIRNDAGELDYRLMEQAREKIAEGFRREVFEYDFTAFAFKKLRALLDAPVTGKKL